MLLPATTVKRAARVYLTEWSNQETLAAGVMPGAILETYVLGELLKSWWHR